MTEITPEVPIEYEIEYAGARQYKTAYPLIKAIAGIPLDRENDTRTLNSIIGALLEIMHNDSDKVNEDLEYAREILREDR
jgi:hypothetical protein